MAFFVGAGTIAEEVVRKETRNGVLAVFRLETGAPNDRRLWIDVEAWGQLAGTVAHHGSAGRSVLVSGRLTYKTWRDRESGEARDRLVVTALDVDLLGDGIDQILLPSTVIAEGTIETVYPNRPTKKGTVNCFRLASGRAGSKTGRLWIDVEHWIPSDVRTPDACEHRAVAIVGRLDYRSARRRAGSAFDPGIYLRADRVALSQRVAASESR